MKSRINKAYLPVTLIFVLLNSFIQVFRSFLEKNGFNQTVLILANLILFILTLVGMVVQLKGLRSPNPQAFVRGVYTSLIVKMLVVLVAVFIYAFLNKEHVNKPAIFTSMGIYILYTVVEVASLMKAAKSNAR